MNKEEIRQVTAHDEMWVPTKERVKISTTNVRLEIIVPQKEETFQVIIDFIKNSTCYKAFIISTEVSEILMQQFCMYMDHMHQPWRTLAAIVNKCLFGNDASNDRLRKSRIDILRGMFYRENIGYLEIDLGRLGILNQPHATKEMQT
nr:hypothetical protein [Tanacetum cinerariifolium]